MVEPWFLGDGAGTPGSEDFAAWRAEAEAAGVRFWPSVSHLPAQSGPRVALIAGRAGDCPALFSEAIEAGVSHIFLEKPGAPSVEAMEAMAAEAEVRRPHPATASGGPSTPMTSVPLLPRAHSRR